MSIVVGIAPTQDNRAAIELGIVLARSYGKKLIAVTIDSATWPPSPVQIDASYREAIREIAEADLDKVRAVVPDDIESEFLIHPARSSRRGLLEVCAQREAHRLVIGPSADEKAGRITLGSVSSGLLHSARLPVALAPQGFRAEAGARLGRITAAYSGSSTSASLILGAALVSAEAGTRFRIASFAPQPRVLAAARIGMDIESSLVDEWTERIRTDTEEILGSIEAMRTRLGDIEVAVGTGESWEAALSGISWESPEVMMLGSSGLGALKRVSLGSHAMRILQNSPVPVVVVPRRAKSDYTSEAFSRLRS